MNLLVRFIYLQVRQKLFMLMRQKVIINIGKISLSRISLKGMVLNMDYDLKIMQNENGFWYICSYGYILDGFGSFETKEQAERVI